MKIPYLRKNFHRGSAALIEQADVICREYEAQGSQREELTADL